MNFAIIGATGNVGRKTIEVLEQKILCQKAKKKFLHLIWVMQLYQN